MSIFSETQRPPGTNSHATFKVTSITFRPHAYSQLELQQVILTMPTCTEFLPFDWLISY